MVIVRILAFWYLTQPTSMCIKWKKITLNISTFQLHGVRQGGVLAPELFAIYIGDLSQDLAICKSRCYIYIQYINHVMYADKICLLTPSVFGLQHMLDVCFDLFCEEYFTENQQKYNYISIFILLILYVLYLNLKIIRCIVQILDWTAMFENIFQLLSV